MQGEDHELQEGGILGRRVPAARERGGRQRGGHAGLRRARGCRTEILRRRRRHVVPGRHHVHPRDGRDAAGPVESGAQVRQGDQRRFRL